jgi:hypothetical protein
MAITHSKVSWQKYRREVTRREQKTHDKTEEMNHDETNEQSISSALYRTPEFVWNKEQIRFLSDLLSLIRSVIQEWKE